MTERREIYLDNAATTPLDPEVLAAMLPFFEEIYANPSSVHPPGQRARKAVEAARERAAVLLDAPREGIVFTSGGSEANNLVLRGLAGSLGGKRIIVSRLEHPSVSAAAALLARRGYEVVSPANDSTGRIDLDHLADLLAGKRTAMVSLIHGSNEVGTIQDAGAVGGILETVSPKTWFHLDAVQSAGFVPLRAREWRVDSLALSAHKLHGPKGAGIAAFFRDATVEPLVAGGGQEGNRRSGTENTPAIVGGVEALDRAFAARPERAARAGALKDRLRRALASGISGIRFNGDAGGGLPHILSVSFSGLLGEVLLHHLEREGIMVSAGSACHARRNEPSETLRALGVPPGLARGTIRFSFSHLNDPAEIDAAARAVIRQAAFLREVGLP